MMDSVLGYVEPWKENPCLWSKGVQFAHSCVKYSPAFTWADGKDVAMGYQPQQGELTEKLCSLHSPIKNNHKSAELVH